MNKKIYNNEEKAMLTLSHLMRMEGRNIQERMRQWQ
jgi:hypothetical protein